MFVIVCKLDAKYYVPEEFEDGMYPREIEKAKKFPNQTIALQFMIDNAYDQNDWYRWEVEQI